MHDYGVTAGVFACFWTGYLHGVPIEAKLMCKPFRLAPEKRRKLRRGSGECVNMGELYYSLICSLK